MLRKNEISLSHMDPERLDEIFRYIGDHPEKSQSKKVEEFVELLSALRHGLSSSERVRIITRLGNVLSAYQWVARVAPTGDKGYQPIYFFADRGSLSQDDRWERESIRDLLKIVPYLGKRPRIRRCDNADCKRWFFAKTERRTNKYCSTTCRVHNYDTNPARREEKKVYMRNHRLVLKERDERLKRRIGFGRVPKRRVKTRP